jgi:hypothetical protein
VITKTIKKAIRVVEGFKGFVETKRMCLREKQVQVIGLPYNSYVTLGVCPCLPGTQFLICKMSESLEDLNL